jgi:preprotein translocase SecE subunit
MANSFTQYLKDTQAELRHVAWPTRMQTIVYSILIAAISVGVALYLGFFDFLFTSGLSHLISTMSHNTPAVTQQQNSATSTVQFSTTSVPLKDLLPKNNQ